MANWRRKVLSLFPEMRRDAERPDFTVYMVFFDLLPRVRSAHDDADEETLRRIYGFAEWCSEQKAKDLWNAAGVAFYEHLFDSHQRIWSDVVQWLSPYVVENVWGLWEWRLNADTLEHVRRLFAERRRHRYREARLSRS